jgi:hypothetical protein
LRQTPEEAALTEVENVPATHLVHALTETAPSVADQVPSLHDTLKIQFISFDNINSNTTPPPRKKDINKGKAKLSLKKKKKKNSQAPSF